jgi:hypothetical protein
MFKVLILALVVSSCGFADVIYDFSGQGFDEFNSTSFNFSIETVAQNFFTVEADDVPTTGCTLQPVPSGGVDCAHIIFYPDGSSESAFAYAEISLSGPSGGSYNWFFTLGSFGAPGVYSTIASTAAQGFVGQLQVATVPELVSLYLSGLGVSALVFMVYCRKRRGQPTNAR